MVMVSSLCYVGFLFPFWLSIQSIRFKMLGYDGGGVNCGFVMVGAFDD